MFAAIPAVSRDLHVFPLSLAQERVWSSYRARPESGLYQVSSAVELIGEFDVGILRRVLELLVQRHEPMRTTFEERDEGPVQIIQDTVTVEVPVIDLRELDEPARAERVEALRYEHNRAPLRLETGPAWRVCVLRLAADRYILLKTFHHIIFDGWSSAVIEAEISAGAQALKLGRALSFPRLPVQAADLAVWQRQQREQGAWDEPLSWWRDKLGGQMSFLPLPLDLPRPARRASHDGAIHLAHWSAELGDKLKRVSRELGATPFMISLAIFDVFLHLLTGERDICVGTSVAARSRPELSGLLGCLINRLILRDRVRPDMSFRELVHGVRGTVLEGFRRQDVPFELVMDQLETDWSDIPDAPHPPQVNLLFHNKAVRAQPTPGLQWSVLEGHEQTIRSDLRLELTPTPDGLGVSLTGRADLFQLETLAAWTDELEQLFEQLLDRPDLQLRELTQP